jgi:uncharacterized protein (TIGR03435 family)
MPRSPESAGDRTIAAAVLIVLAAATGGHGQEFDVVSIKPNATVAGPMGAIELNFRRGIAVPRNGRLRIEAATVESLIQVAYDVKDFQVLDAPSWASSERYDVEALTRSDATPGQIRGMFQSLLRDRFNLILRREMKKLPVYELWPARGGLTIAKMKPGECVTMGPETKPFTADLFCGQVKRRIVAPHPDRLDRIEAGGMSMAAFVDILSNEVGRTVIDKTGFTDLFNVRLEFAPDLPGFDTGPPVRSSSSVAPGLSIFTALQEQLGLRLASADGPVDVLVIERVDRPSAN